MGNYVTYHLHTMDSLLDSCTSFEEYIDYAVSIGQKAICFTEHGNIYNYVKKYMYCKEHGIKYLFGVECYLTESIDDGLKIRDNYHTVLIAKNADGFHELCRVLSKSSQADHRYYTRRITFDEFLGLSDNVIKISACLASPLRKYKARLDEDEANGMDVALRRDKYVEIAKHYDYYEIQYHDGDQIEYNQYLYKLAKIFNKPLIAGTDTHSLNQYKADCRIILKYGKTDGDWGDGENELDLTYKTYDELVEAFRKQNAIPEDAWIAAIENTNVMADSCDDFELDTSLKYPILYPGKDEEQIMWDRIHQMYEDKVRRGVIDGKDKRYLENINEEMRVFKKINMVGFMLFMSELMSWTREQNLFTSPCRGSVGGSTVAYVTDIIDLDPVKMNTVFSRFANEYREEVGDIDTDFYEDDRPKIYQHMFDRFGSDKCAYILALGTLADKAVIDTIGKAFRVKAEQEGKESRYTLEKIKDIKAEWDVDQDKTRLKYPDLFKYYDGLVGCVVSQSMHPAGIVVAPVNLIENYGVFYNNDEQQILPIDMDEVHETGLVKYDILGLKNVGIIAKTCEYAGIPLPHFSTMDWSDQKVFENMVNNPVGIFQFESEYAFRTLKVYYNNMKRKGMPFGIDDMTLCNACIRPSGASYRDDLIALHDHKNPSPMIDELLSNTHGRLVYQEQVIAFLQEICGLSGGEADNVRRAIGRKQVDRLEAALPAILDGYCQKSDKPRNVAEEEAKEFIKVIEDSSSYMFGFNHATGYSMLGYLCAYYRYYYPIEFCTAFLNCSKSDEDIYNGTMLAKSLGFTVVLPQFRQARGGWWFDKTKNVVTKGIGSIKNMNAAVAEEMYELRNNKYSHFTDLLYDLKQNTTLKSNQLEILIRLDFFKEFGDIPKLEYVSIRFDQLADKKVIARDKAANLGIDIDVIRRHSKKETPTRIDNIDVLRWADGNGVAISDLEDCKKRGSDDYSFRRLMTKYGLDDQSPELLPYATKVVVGRCSDINNRELLYELEDTCTPPDCPISRRLQYEQEYLGYIDYVNPALNPRYALVMDIDTKFSPKVLVYCLKSGETCEIRIHSRRDHRNKDIVTSWKELPLNKGDIIYMKRCKRMPRQQKTDRGWVSIPGEYVWWMNDYSLGDIDEKTRTA